jgi:monomeric sarcosine oxidase
MSDTTFDVAVVGAGVFGAWTAWHLTRAGKHVLLVDAYGPANARASSAGESRIIRMGYGPDEIYTRWSQRALGLWQEFFARTGQPLFHRTGVLWLARDNDAYAKQSLETIGRCGVRYERLGRSELEKRFPEFSLEGVDWGLFEPESGALMARRAVQAVVADAMKSGCEYRQAAAKAPTGKGRADAVELSDGSRMAAGAYVFACGPWLGKVFPNLLAERIFPSRQEVFFFGVPAGNARFAPPAMPTWIFLADEVYGLPDLESRGFKIALDRHGERVDPDTHPRVVSAQSAEEVRRYVARRFPALKDAPVVETRVCQYENTSNGDFLIDRHPEMENVWLVGGGSGHGFKHGPSLGEYVAKRVLEGGATDARFSLAAKQTFQKRAVY